MKQVIFKWILLSIGISIFTQVQAFEFANKWVKALFWEKDNYRLSKLSRSDGYDNNGSK